MKRLICLILTIAGVAAVAYAPASSTAASTGGTVTGVGSGLFPARTSFAGINLTGFQVATGVITESDGSAGGVLHAVLSGRTILGSVRVITLDGDVTQGIVSSDSSSFSGLATLSLGDGFPAVPGVPFNVDTRSGAMTLTIQSTVLPSSAFSQGGLDIE